MTTKHILEYVCLFLGKDELLGTTYFDSNGTILTQDDEKELDILRRCLNLTIADIASDYMPIIKSKEMVFNNFACEMSSIDNSIQEIVAVKSKTGKHIPYKIIDSKLIAQTNLADVRYKVYPQQAQLDGNCEDFDGRIPDRVIAYGVCMEYCFISLLYDDATIWENRYKTALLINSRKKGELKLKKRRWF